MPRHPQTSRRGETVLKGSFGKAPHSTEEDPVLLHIGDSHEPPGPEMPLSPEFTALDRWWFRYPAPPGTGRLRRALARWYRDHHGVPTEADQILVTPGATAALNTLVTLLCDPGDEVIVPTPVWPLFPGMTRLAGARVVELPLHDRMAELDPDRLIETLENSLTPRTVAIYLNTPNNPSGTLLDPAQCRAFAEFARRNDLWLLSDEAYDGMAFEGRPTPTMAALSDDDPRVVVVSTSSKMLRAAGLRVGWVRLSGELAPRVLRVATFQNYSASALAQTLVERALSSRAEWSPALLADLERRRDRFVEAIGLDLEPPAGTYFAFLDLRRWLGASFDAAEAVEALAAEGVFVTPGIEFGKAYRGWIRACFASEDEERTIEAASRLGRWIRDRPSRRN